MALTLTEKQWNTFNGIYFRLLKFVNETRKINEVTDFEPRGPILNIEKFQEIDDALWEDKETIIDEYLAAHPELPDEERKTVEDWKRSVSGDFAIVKQLKGGAVFL